MTSMYIYVCVYLFFACYLSHFRLSPGVYPWPLMRIPLPPGKAVWVLFIGWPDLRIFVAPSTCMRLLASIRVRVQFLLFSSFEYRT